MKKLIIAFFFLTSFNAWGQNTDLPDFAGLVEKQGPAVVNISTTQTIHQAGTAFPGIPENDPFYDFFRQFAPPQGPREYQAKSLGSGFIISSDGYIMTNAHVVDGADEVTVRLTDKREFKAKIIGSDKKTDVALLKINASDLPKVSLGDPSKLRVGEWVVAIGSPFGFNNSVTAGIVSGKGRTLPDEDYVPLIQTDVAINPGNSGGPLFNMNGEVIGINSQIYSRTGGYMGVSFAIPIDVAVNVTNQLKSHGKVSRGWMGVSIQDISKELADSFGLSKPSGAIITSVEKGSPAAKAGLQPSDIILKFDGNKIENAGDLPRAVGNTHPGKKVTVEVWRNKSTKDIDMTLGEAPGHLVASAASKNIGGGANRLGLALAELTPDQRQQLKIGSGLLVENAQGLAAQAGIRRGDVILAINNLEVKNVDQFNQTIKKLGEKGSVALLVRRGDNVWYAPIKLNG